MPYTDYPNGITSMGSPVSGGGNFAGWWDNDVWFVDYDNGTRTGQRGKNDIENPQKDLYQVLQECGAGDTIFVRPRTTVATVGSNNEVITPAATEAANWTISQGLHHLSIIGTSRNQGLAHTAMFQSYAALTTPTIDVLAPYCTIENVGFKGISAQVSTGLLRGYSYTPGTQDGFALTVDNCQINVYQSSNGGGIVMDSGRYNRILNTEFWHCRSGINLASTAGNINGSVIQNCIFWGLDTDIDVDILLADTTHTLIDSCIFEHDQPAKSGGSRLYYIQAVGTAKGSVTRCMFGTEALDFNTAVSAGSLDAMANYCSHDTGLMTTT